MANAGDYHEKVLKSARTFFARWQGAPGELWELTVSHRSLRILLRRPEQVGNLQAGNLLIACGGPVSIRSPARWDSSELSIELTPLPGEQRPGFRVRTAGADTEIVCEAIEVAENVKLW